MTNIYDDTSFFNRYVNLRKNKISINEIVEKPAMFSLLGSSLFGKKILDLGCGYGEHLAYYQSLGASYLVGIDLSLNMINKATELFKNQNNNVKYSFYHQSMMDLESISEDDFDIITSSYAFHYIDDFDLLLSNIRNKLKPNGTLIFSQEHPVTTCHKQGKRWEKNDKKEQICYRLNHYRQQGLRERNWFNKSFKTYHRTFSSIINALIKNGFMIEKVLEPMLDENDELASEFSDLIHRPPILVIKARKI